MGIEAMVEATGEEAEARGTRAAEGWVGEEYLRGNGGEVRYRAVAHHRADMEEDVVDADQDHIETHEETCMLAQKYHNTCWSFGYPRLYRAVPPQTEVYKSVTTHENRRLSGSNGLK